MTRKKIVACFAAGVLIGLIMFVPLSTFWSLRQPHEMWFYVHYSDKEYDFELGNANGSVLVEVKDLFPENMHFESRLPAFAIEV